MSIGTIALAGARLIFFVICIFAGGELSGQSIIASDVSSRFLNDSDYYSIIHSQVFPISQKHNVPLADFNARYTNNVYRFAEVLQPLLQSRFSVLDEKYGEVDLASGGRGYAKAKSAYVVQASDVIETTLRSTSLFSVLSAIDYSDRILGFHADITVKRNGTLEISEFITVFNGNGQTSIDSDVSSPSFANNDIQRGIVRDFPTSYEDSSGFWTDVGFKLKSVLKNGESEPFVEESLANGTRIKMGTKELILPEGIYKYRIDYETNRQLIFHAGKDELYWNVNGNGWVFTADSISCLVHFPDGAVIKEYACYTGSQGSTDHDCNSQLVSNSNISFSTSKRLEGYQGLTIAVSIQKGILAAPSKSENIISFLKSNFIIPALSVVLILLFVFYYIVWYLKGRDPEKGVIYPRFSPPTGLSPADVGYIMEQRFGSHLFTSALIDLAVKKMLRIEVKQEGMILKFPAYYFSRPADMKGEPDSSVYGFNIVNLYGQAAKRGTYNSTLNSFKGLLEDTLQKRFLIRKGKSNSLYGLFSLNKGYTRFGGFLLVASVLAGIFFLIGHPSQKLLVITIAMIVALFIIHFVFVRIMSAYTRQGREIADHIAGFKMYLDQAEQRVYEALTPPEKTLELFEKYLPYAIALKVENSWADKFESIMEKAIGQGYQPAYYVGIHGSSFNMHSMSHGLSSGLSGTVSSASSPPSSSSGGSGGGGSSGGGGGGGGGGGW